MHDDPAVESSLDFLHGHKRADLHFDGHVQPLKYVIAADGRLVAPVMVAMLSAADTTLFVPEDREGAMELMVTLEQFEEGGELGGLADRWRIYHGEPPDVRWAVMTIDAAKYRGLFIDGEAFAEANPLSDAEPAFCREANQRHVGSVRRLCSERGGMDVENPVMVGIDPRGFDVRATFDIVRVRFPSAARTIAEARAMIVAAK
jgi:hypothetical protein